MQSRAQNAIAAGLVAASATAGVLVGFGDPAIGRIGALEFAGRAALHLHSASGATTTLAVAAGLALHLIAVGIWATMFTQLEYRVPTRGALGAAIATASSAFAFDTILIPDPLRVDAGAQLSTWSRVLLYVVLAAAFSVGMRVALLSRQPR